MYWMFLVLSLVLQAYVVSNSYGYGESKLESEDGKKNEKAENK